MPTISATTELEAVNSMLHVIGESPVSSLEDSRIVDAVTARSILSEMLREVQSEGWHYNTEHEYPLAATVDTCEVRLPKNLCAFDLDKRRHPRMDIVVRGDRLYDRRNHTYRFDQTIYGTVTLFLPFTEMPQSARRYVTIKAARVFLERMVGDQTVAGFTARDEARARSILVGEDAEQNDLNILTDAPGVAFSARRDGGH